MLYLSQDDKVSSLRTCLRLNNQQPNERAIVRKIKVRKVTGVSATTSDRWFIDDEAIEEFMREKYFRKEPRSDSLGMDFAPTRNIDVFIYINDNTSEYRLVIGLLDEEVAIDAGTVKGSLLPCEKGYSLRLSGTFLEDCGVVCED